MPLPFSHVCELLEQCSKLCGARQRHHDAVVSWFSRRRALIDAHDTNVAALLSTLLPEKRTDRVYCIQAPTLEKIIGRALMLGSSRMKELRMHAMPGQGVDLADCVERILLVTPTPQQSAICPVTVEHIDAVLHSMASRIRWSAPKIREAKTSMTYETRAELEALYLRFSPIEAKWFTRLVLKNYEPLIFHADTIYGLCDKALPSALKVLDDFVAAIEAVQYAKTRLLPTSSRANTDRRNILALVKPQCGIKIGRQSWLKARSIKHCLDMGHGKMSVERKVDGEYCQIHVNLSRRPSPVQIFSKSGKDSTEDRSKLHTVIMDSLRRSQSEFSIKQRCILEGELVVYSDLERKIRPFHTIRNYVTRRGRYLNTEQDSPPKSYEHLMIVYYDILMVDDMSLLGVKQSERRQQLERVVKTTPGRSELVFRQVIDFDHRLAASHLRKAFASVIVHRGEGLVLKPDDPYFDFSPGLRRFASSCIKLKKEYIGNIGEIGDVAIVGAGYDPGRAKSYTLSGLKWTHFYVGCLNNREEVQRWEAKPGFTVVGIVEMNETQLKSFVMYGSTETVPLVENTQTDLSLAPGCDRRPALRFAFLKPSVIDLRCFSFDKEGNTGFWTPRFPGISKIHFDRDFRDVMTFDELQAMAEHATSSPELEDSQENLAWIARLEAADPRGVAVDAASQLTASSLATPSPRRRTQSVSDVSSPKSSIASRSQPCSSRARAATQFEPIPLLLVRNTALPLTPPTSSAMKERQLENTPDEALAKSVAKPEHGNATPKRRKPRDQASTPTASTKRACKQHEPPRYPLGNVERNSSQLPGHLASPHAFDQENRSSSKSLIDLTSSPVSPQVFSCRPERPCEHAEDDTKVHETTTMTIPDDDEPHDPSQQATGSKRSDSFSGTCNCDYDGNTCLLATMNLVLAPYLRNDDRLGRHIASHGVDDVTFGCGTILASPRSGKKNFLLLVDSVSKVRETEEILTELEHALGRTQVEARPWVHVFDWRLLVDMTISKEGQASENNYAGFCDPWSRWHVGII